MGLYCTLVHKPLPLIETLISRKPNEVSEISQVYSVYFGVACITGIYLAVSKARDTFLALCRSMSRATRAVK